MYSLVAIQDVRYASRDFRAGERFDALSESDASVLKMIGKAEDAPAVAAPVAETPVHASVIGQTETREMAAEDQQPQKGSPRRRSSGRGRYNRTDMRPTE